MAQMHMKCPAAPRAEIRLKRTTHVTGTVGDPRWRATALVVALAALSAVTGCRGCGRGASLGEAGAAPEEVDPGKLSPELALAPGDDTQATPQTPVASRAALPTWAEKTTHGPSLPDGVPEALIKELEMEGTKMPASGVLACAVKVEAFVKTGLSGLLGLPSAPTLNVEIDPGTSEKFRVAGMMAAQERTVSAPLVTLDASSHGQATIEVTAQGRVEKTVRVPIAMTPRGTLEGKRDANTVRCVLLPQSVAEIRFAKVLPEVASALRGAALDAHLVQEEARGFGQQKLVETVRRETSRLAAYVGWSDPRVSRRTALGARILSHHKARVLEAIDTSKEVTTLPGFGRFVSAPKDGPCTQNEIALAFALTEDIFRPKDGCAFRLSLERGEGSREIRANVFFKKLEPPLEGDVVLADGEVLIGQEIGGEGSFVAGTESNERILAKTLGGAFHVRVGESLAGRAKPRALVLRSGSARALIPL